jgi:hypothetical protein
MGKSAPKAPDYEAAAQAQGQASREVTEQQTWANRPDQTTPWGQTSWSNQQQWDPSTEQWLNRWSQDTTLNPESQRALDAQLGLTAGRSELAGSLLPRAQQEFGQAVDWNQFSDPGSRVQAGNLTPEQLQRQVSSQGLPGLNPAERYRQDAEDAIYGKMTNRLKERFGRENADMESKLYAKGLREGDQAYGNEQRDMRDSQNLAYDDAMFNSIIGSGQEASRMFGMDSSARGQLFGERMGQGNFANAASGQAFGQQAAAGGQNFGQQMQSSQYDTQLRQQQIAEELQRRGFSLNEINALITGQQVGMPSMPGFNTANRAEGTQFLQAAQMQGQADLDRFNAQQAATQGMMSGIGSMAGGFNGFGF